MPDIVRGRRVFRDSARRRPESTTQTVTPPEEIAGAEVTPEVATQEVATVRTPRIPARRGGLRGLAAPAGSPIEAQTVAEAADIVNRNREEEQRKSLLVPVVRPEKEKDTDVDEPGGITTVTAKPTTFTEEKKQIQKEFDKRVGEIEKQPARLSKSRDIAALEKQRREDLEDIRFEEQLETEGFTSELRAERIAGARDIAEKEGISLTAADQRFRSREAARAKLDPEEKRSFDTIVEEVTREGFDQTEAFNVAIAEFEKDGVDADDMQKANDSIASIFGKNFADEAEDNFLIDIRKVDPAIVRGDRKLIDTRKIGETVKAGQAGARVTNSYLKSIFDIDQSLIPNAISQILSSNATDDAKRQASAFSRDFFTGVETGIAPGAVDIEKRFLGGELTPQEEEQFIGRLSRLKGIGKKGEKFDFEELPLEAQESVLRVGKLAFGTRISDTEGKRVLSIVSNPENRGKTVFEISAGILGYKPRKNKEFGDGLVNILAQNLGRDEGLSVYPLDALTIQLNKGNFKGAINLTEKLVTERAKQIEGEDFISESFTKRSVQKVNEVEGLINDASDVNEDLAIGNFTGTVENWLGRFKGTKEAKIKAKIVSSIAEMRNKLLGSAVTETEERFLEPLIPELSDRIPVLLGKLDTIRSQGLIDLNSIRTTFGLPEINQDQLLDASQRIPLYEQLEGQQTQESFVPTAIDIIKQSEGFVGTAAPDIGGVPTIGFGFTTIGGEPVQIGDTITQSEAEAELERQLPEFRTWENVITTQLNDAQKSALTSFTFNLGQNIWDTSPGQQLSQLINNNEFGKAADLITKFNKFRKEGQLVESRGLTARREREAQTFA